MSRELARNTCPAVGYASAPAQALSAARRPAARPRARLHVQGVAWRVVLTPLAWNWSSQQISGTLKRMWPKDPTQRVSHETIYNAIYAQTRGKLRRQLIACLRHGHSTRMSRKRGTDRRGQIPDLVSIHVRPPEVEENTNGLLRQYLPKVTDLSVYSQDELDVIADSRNNRHRATHAFHSPLEVFARILEAARQTPTSIH